MDYNSMDEGRDIPPDEEIPNYWLRARLPVGQQVSDSQTNGHAEAMDLTEDGTTPFNSHGANSHIGVRTNFHVREPVDTTSDSVGAIRERVFAPRQPQRHNGTTYYNSEENRLTTFSDWRYQHVVRKEDLARNGFVYTGTSDKVRCVFCNSILRQWEAGDIVEQEHRRLNPRCPFNNGEEVGNIPFHPLANGHHNGCSAASPVSPSRSRNAQVPEERGRDIDPIEDRYGSHAAYQNQMQNGGDRHLNDSASASSNSLGGEEEMASAEYSTRPRVQSMAIEPARLETFKDWPPQMKQKPEQLAQAGLYYTGDGDRTKCFHCAGLLYNWDPEDDPFVEHARWFPACQYMKLIKGEEFIKNAKSGKATNDAVMQTPAVLAVLADGFTVEQVSKAVEAMKKKEGSAVVISAPGILETIYALEDASKQSTVEQSLPNGDVQKLKEENETLKDKQLCKVCMERDVEVIFAPCHHLVCCASCGAGLSECPICRTKITSMVKVYMS